MKVHSFAPVVDAHSRVLILGSMPGRVSLQAQQYYAHPRNLFWGMMETLLDVRRAAPYAERLAQLLVRRVALWDVLEACTRSSSLDSDIIASSIVPNDFIGLFERHPAIHSVCFNGAKAASAFRRHVLPKLPRPDSLTLHDLPSTSPANAAIPLDTKRAAWRAVARSADQSAVPGVAARTARGR